MRVRRGFAEESDIMATVTKLTPMQKERNDELITAAKNGDIDRVKELITIGADVDARNNLGRTALHETAWYKYIKIAKILIEKGADVDAKDNREWTALHWATVKGNVEIVKILIEMDADVDARDIYGWTALHVAAGNERVEITEVLIEKGADVDAKNKNERTAQELAIENKHYHIAELIENAKRTGAKNKNSKKEVIITIKDIDILNMDMDELVRRADESAKKLCRKE